MTITQNKVRIHRGKKGEKRRKNNNAGRLFFQIKFHPTKFNKINDKE